LGKERIEKLKKGLEEHKAKQAAEAEKFDITKVLESAGEIKEKYVAAIKRTVRYGALTLKDSLEIMKPEDPQQRAIVILWKMLQKADSAITLEQVEALPLDVATAILTEIGRDFLQLQTATPLKSGLDRTARRSYAA
jgi:hypothetical protein